MFIRFDVAKLQLFPQFSKCLEKYPFVSACQRHLGIGIALGVGAVHHDLRLWVAGLDVHGFDVGDEAQLLLRELVNQSAHVQQPYVVMRVGRGVIVRRPPYYDISPC